MIIFIDSNIFYNHWFLRQANFKYLFNFIDNYRHKLIISNVVLEEVDNLHQREHEATEKELRKCLDKISLLNLINSDKIFHQIDYPKYSLELQLRDKVENIEFLEYSSIPQDVVVKRVLESIKPFGSNEKGYRDTLIWLSLLEYLKNRKPKDDVIFITKNKKDFFRTESGKLVLHPDLAKDAKDNGIISKIIPFLSIYDFVKSTIDISKNTINIDAIIDASNDFLRNEGISSLQKINNKTLLLLLDDCNLNNGTISNIINVKIIPYKEICDFEINNWSNIDDNTVFIDCEYSLEEAIIEISIFKSDYELNKSKINKNFTSVKFDSDIAILSCYVDILYNACFLFNPKTKLSSDYDLTGLSIPNKYYFV
jgi:hypothetical protein